ncbi:ferredoxin-fold anticodon-binding domain-containing protein 1 isoform X1 [Synchiropus splendidus]|uniref:ferredoxin-fold anticodon-binding domain-containing protein 1 isoform X1 n=1 Tax=Synchiropus splendidus TaxID=270530 RepID=UPI00237E034D|nr:ferredoxin-fold anticodon-binding domain-containing protein 1 isoform X1 [Synchiropus splendidus]
MSDLRSILLVGEGNFSFSAALTRFYSSSETRITATCLQDKDAALRQQQAADNIQTVEGSGGAVLFEVDCTKLEECASLRGCAFDRILFNFPHCGRKSGVKKNRQLLKDFFLSCVQFLAEEGEVHVSLCNGQGGTPVDQPRREWFNSWQVVAMAAEAHLILSDVHKFESEKYQSYKCTGYRSQDKGFHLENALLHVFTRSLPYASAKVIKLEEDVDGQRVQFNMPAELGDFMFRDFLASDSVHPVKLVQDFILDGVGERWPVSMTTASHSFLLTAKQWETNHCGVEGEQCYWIHPLQKGFNSDSLLATELAHLTLLDSQDTHRGPSEKPLRNKAADGSRFLCSHSTDPDEDLYLLRPSLIPKLSELHNKNQGGKVSATESNVNYESATGCEKLSGRCNGVTCVLYGMSGLVFRNLPVNFWNIPVFHELHLTGVFSSQSEPVKLFEQTFDRLLSPLGISIVAEDGGFSFMAHPMGSVGKVLSRTSGDDITVTVSINLDVLAVVLFSIPDWRLLWSYDPRFLKQFAPRPSPGTSYHAFSLFPEIFSFDISFWIGSSWEELKFHALVREASLGTVEQVKLIDKFSHPDLSQTSYCYRLIYQSHTHALSHTQALKFHKNLESLLSSRLQVTIR